MLHVYDWLDAPPVDDSEAIAKKFLTEACRPAVDKNFKWLEENPLFCTWRGKRYRVTGASRLGDVWLSEDFTRVMGYDNRVDVAECSEWAAK